MAVDTLADLVRTNANKAGDRLALTFGDESWTFAELDERTSRVADALAGAGVAAGDRVAILAKNRPELFELLFGGAKVNAATVAVNWRLAAPEVAYVVNDAGAKVLVVEEEFLPVLDAVRDELATVSALVVIGEDGRYPTFDEWRSEAAKRPSSTTAGPDDVALQLYTSGTTGRPKGAQITNRNLFTMLPNTARDWGFSADSVNLVSMPLFHVGGVGWALVGMYAAAPTVLLHEVDRDLILRSIGEHGVTHALVVPAVLRDLLEAPSIDQSDLSTLECIVYGASPISVDVLTRAIDRFGCRFIQGYGLTETTGAVIHLLPDDHDPNGPNAHRLRAAGRPMAGVEVRIVDPQTRADVAIGEVGEVWLRSDQIMPAYWNRPEDSAAAIDADRWFRSGDAGYLDPDGYLYINDRVKDLIISGGENIYPAEIENALMSHPGVADVAVIGVPSERWGETPKAIVVAATDPPPTFEQLRDHCRLLLAGFKCPTSVDLVAELPRNPTGKVLKRDLRAPFWDHHERPSG